MGHQQHIVKKQVFDIYFNSDQIPFELQNRISHLFHTRIEDIMGGVFNRIIPEDTLARFDNLDIDLGVLPYEQMENVLPEKLEDALEKALKDKFSLRAYYPDKAEGTKDRPIFKSSYINMLAYFLVTGTLPWWASGPVMTDPVKVMKKMLQENARAVRELLLRAGQFTYVRRRLVYQFPVEVIRAVVSILEPHEAEFIFEYHQEVTRRQQETRRVKDELSQVKKAVWMFILTYLLTERGSRFNQKMFVQSTLRQMAAHYSLHYEELLSLFASPLYNESFVTRPLPLLTQIIKELSFEQSSSDPGDYITDGRTDKMTLIQGKAAGEEEIILYYLQWGSLPSRADHKDSRQFNAEFLKLIRETPERARRLILGMDNKEAGIEHIVLAFDEEVIYDIIKLVEPANAESIIHYMKLSRTMQEKEAAINTDNQSFTRSVRRFVLSYLLIDRGSVFNNRVFLESNIRQMAHLYNMQFETLLRFLIRATGEESYTVPPPLTNLLLEIQKEHKGNPEVKNKEFLQYKEERPVLQRRGGRGMQGKTLFDVLRFWVMHGFLPWWGKVHEVSSPISIWEALYSEHSDDLLRLVQYAGTDHHMKQRIVYQLPLSLFLATFAGLPEGKEAIKMYRFTEGLLTRLSQWESKNRGTLQNILMIAWWDGFIASGYRAFDLGRFVSLSIQRLSQWTGVFAENMRLVFLEMIRHYQKTTPGKLTPSQERLIEAIGRPLEEMDLWSDGSPDIRTLILQYIPPEKRNNEEEVLSESLRILEYFLTWNKWPDQILGLTDYQAGVLLKGLIQLLAREKPKALRSILQRSGYSPAARIRLHDAFSLSRDSRDESIRHLLQEFYEKDLILYFADIAGLRDDATDKKFLEMLDEIVKHSNDEQGKKLRHSLLSSSAMSAFIAEKYGDETFYHLIENVADSQNKGTVLFLHRVQELLWSAVPDTLEREKIILLFRRFSLHYMIGQHAGKAPAQFFALLLALLAQEQTDGGMKLFQSLLHVIHTRWSPATSLPPDLITQIEGQLKKLVERERINATFKKNLIEREEPLFSHITEPPASLPHREKYLAQELLQEKNWEREERKRAKDLLETDEDTIYILNAGLVLLHPFLSTYFSRMGLTEEGKFIDEEASFRGIHLLQFLSDGEEHHPEHELVLNKILCGLPAEEPVPVEIIYTEQEIEVSMELLNIVIQQWEKIRNTSIEGFRASFLQRDGALTLAEDNSWKLRIEQRGYDVLLQTLPWGIGMIRTPWMENFLYVEWT